MTSRDWACLPWLMALMDDKPWLSIRDGQASIRDGQDDKQAQSRHQDGCRRGGSWTGHGRFTAVMAVTAIMATTAVPRRSRDSHVSAVVTCHVIVTCHVSRVTCHVSRDSHVSAKWDIFTAPAKPSTPSWPWLAITCAQTPSAPARRVERPVAAPARCTRFLLGRRRGAHGPRPSAAPLLFVLEKKKQQGSIKTCAHGCRRGGPPSRRQG